MTDSRRGRLRDAGDDLPVLMLTAVLMGSIDHG